ncbi:MAG TPA: alpha/beta hydrolase [Azospirillaceae bacterium]|nr:alpha/beta hydrolase [Azospirillaceae bacterium]
MAEAKSRYVQTNGIRMHLLEQGEGPLVLMCHGWPELSHSWRNQLRALAEAGYRAVAPDMRGFGRTEAPESQDSYTLLHHVGDMVGVLDALGEQTAVVVGHDWGAPVAWHCALFRPDRFRAVAGLSVPHAPRGPGSIPKLVKAKGLDRFYMAYFQEPGRAERELEADPYQTFRRLLVAASGDSEAGWPAMIPEGKTLVDTCPYPTDLPGWLSEEDLQIYAENYRHSGFRGGLNWYRCMDLNWELMGAWGGPNGNRLSPTTPALFLVGDKDSVIRMPGLDKAFANLHENVPGLRAKIMIPGAGHWLQQEAPDAANEALVGFLRGL